MPKLQTGETMPNFTFQTAFEQGKTVEELVKKADKTVFWVLRYIGCTVCRYDVSEIQRRYDEFKAKNAQVVVVMQSDPEVLKESLAEEKLPFDIICDTDMQIYNSLEIKPAESMQALVGEDMAKLQEKGAKAKAKGFSHGKYEGDEQQLPAMFITDKEGKVLYAHYGKTIMDMPTVDEVLEML